MTTNTLLARLQTGLELQKSGRLADAESAFRAALAIDSRSPQALNLLGALCVNANRAQEARDFIVTALAIDPNDAQAHANLGLALKNLGELPLARSHLQRSLELRPDHPVVTNNLASVLREMGDLARSSQLYERALQRAPDYADAWCNLAAVLSEQGQPQRAMQAIDRAISLRPDFATAYCTRGDIFRKKNRWAEAAPCYERALQLDRGLSAATIGLADCLKDLGDAPKAERLLRDLIAADPGSALPHYHLGLLLEQVGDTADAARSYLAAIALAPRLTLAQYQLAQLKGRKVTDAEQADRLRLFDADDLSPEQRAPLAFALSIGCEQRCDFDQAFEFMREANAIRAAQHPYDDSEARAYTLRVQAAFSGSNCCPAAAATVQQSPRVIFVLGMPRSGTTLTEQLLASHPAVYGAGEVSYLEDTIRLSGQMVGTSYPEGVAKLTESQLAELGAFYLKKLARDAAGKPWIVDKTPMNFQYVDFLARILPTARVLHCHRDPIDNCMSIYQRPFDPTHTYSHDLTALGRYYRHYWQLMEFWKSRWADLILDVSYEGTVADVESQCQRLVDFLSLPFDAAMLRFHETARMVRTPSASQVRQPIYRDSVRSWQRYERHLQPLVAALGELAASTPNNGTGLP